MASPWLRGMILGFAIAASPGPIFFLCLRRTLTRGWSSGVAAGLGVATGDGIYAALAAFGVAAITSVLVAQRRWLALLGGVALLVLGLRSLLSSRATPKLDAAPGQATVGYLSMLGLTLANPATILAFAAVFAGLGLGRTGGGPGAVLLIAGVLLGSTLWWVVLASLAASVRRRITPAAVRGISALSGLAILVFGALAVVWAVGRV